MLIRLICAVTKCSQTGRIWVKFIWEGCGGGTQFETADAPWPWETTPMNRKEPLAVCQWRYYFRSPKRHI